MKAKKKKRGRKKLNPKAYRKNIAGGAKKYRGYTLQVNEDGTCTVFRKLYEIQTYDSKRIAIAKIDDLKQKYATA